MTSRTAMPRKIEGLVAKDLGDEFLIYDNGNDRIHVLNVTARDLLMLCDGSRDVEALTAEITARYQVDEPTARGDVERTLARLEELDLIAYV